MKGVIHLVIRVELLGCSPWLRSYHGIYYDSKKIILDQNHLRKLMKVLNIAK
ncbi:hypothetical protein Smp_153570 [Schistosoma mansoni]|uniref:hypothetical protein n=1 Tax=Schistosoma mansoni TaxID=6183 RepID=UPI0001A63F45|nr:hypothetical protein Smp_153570 [Schistosoma mansoni]|eukprot:XP_018654806.1 hypothetical protein Smp_153570 [Schistosoma mansoni]